VITGAGLEKMGTSQLTSAMNVSKEGGKQVSLEISS